MTSQDEDWCNSPKKKSNKDESENCLIHRDDVNEKLSTFTETSWKTVMNAAKIRGDEKVFSKSNEDFGNFQYHRKCYQSYTHKKGLEKYSKTLPVEDSNQKPSYKRTKRVSGSIVADPNKCIICNSKKTAPSGSGYEQPDKIVTEAGALSLWSAAKENNEERILLELAGKDISAIISYEPACHRTCFRSFTKKKPKKISEDLKETAWERLEDYLEENLSKGEVLWLAQIRGVYVDILDENSLPSKSILSRDVKKKLQERMADKLVFHSIPGIGEQVFMKDSDKESHNYRTNKQRIQDCVNVLLDEIADCSSMFENWPACPEKVTSENVSIPPLLLQFVSSLLEGKPKRRTDATKRLTQSLCQDIVYNVSHSRVKTVKHLQLGLYLKRKTGSKELITLLNRMGHCVSYTQVNMHETYFANIQAKNQTARDYVPMTLQPSLFLTFVYDNGDHNAESLFGSSFHCTNGIAIQNIIARPALRSSHHSEVSPRKRRKTSFQPIEVELEGFSSKERHQPSPMTNLEKDLSAFDEILSKSDDLIWVLCHQRDAQQNKPQSIPNWTGFHHLTGPQSSNANIQQVTYLPCINCPPTDMKAVNEMLLQVKCKSGKLNLNYCDLVLDHAIYCKALEILLNPINNELQKSVFIRMGGFHTECIFLAVIGKRFKDAGLSDLIVESEILGPSSVDAAMNGKAYNYAMRMHKIVYTSLWRLKINQFTENDGQKSLIQSFYSSKQFNDLHSDQTEDNLDRCRDAITDVIEAIGAFEEMIGDVNSYGPAASFWQSYLDMVQILLDFNKSNRKGNWDLHLQAIQRMLPWFFAYDRHNYSRHLTYCWSSFLKLPHVNSALYEEFKRGNFSIRRVPGRFNKIPPDQVIEQTINKDQKGAGGIRAFSTTEGTVQRWILSSHTVSKITADMQDTYQGEKPNESKAKDLSKKRMVLDEKLVSNCYNTLNDWGNPFAQSKTLTNISSGIEAPLQIQNDLLQAYNKGKSQCDEFIAKRIESDETKFYDSIKKLNLCTFTSLKKVKSVRVAEKTVAIKSDRQTFARLLMIQRSRNVDLKHVLNFELGSVPYSISNPDGSLRKSQKSKMMDHLEEDIECVKVTPEGTSLIFDGMVMLQKLPSSLKTFGDISSFLLETIIKRTKNNQVFFVTDQYYESSIKGMERKKRNDIGIIKVKITRRDQPKPQQFDKF